MSKRPIDLAAVSAALATALVLAAVAPPSAAASNATTVSLLPIVDGTAFDEGSDGSFEHVDTADSTGIYARNLAPVRTERGLLEFAVSGASGQFPSAVSLSGYINLTQGPPGQPVPVVIIAYPGDGTLTTEDAARPGIQAAAFGVTGPGPFDVNLAPALQLIDPEGALVGLRVEIPGGSDRSPGIRIASSEAARFFAPPQLNITFVPEPSCGTAVLAALSAVMLGRTKRR